MCGLVSHTVRRVGHPQLTVLQNKWRILALNFDNVTNSVGKEDIRIEDDTAHTCTICATHLVRTGRCSMCILTSLSLILRRVTHRTERLRRGVGSTGPLHFL